jgi:PAS domain S-box-containing protein
MKQNTARKKYLYDSGQADFRRLFEESPIPMWIYDDVSLKFLSVNAAAVNYYGYKREEFLRMTTHDIRPKEDVSTSVEIVKIPQLNSFYDSSRRRHIKKNGQVFYVQVYSHAVQFSGKAARVMWAMDINNRVLTELKNQELNLLVREHKTRLDDILSSINEVVWSYNADSHEVIYINSASATVYGYTPDELIGNNTIMENMVYPEDKWNYKLALDNIANQGKAVFEYRILHKDGSVKYILNQAVLKESKTDAPSVINGIAIDITGLRTVEQALKANVAEMKTILESITDGFFAVDNKWEFTYVNKESERLLEHKRNELIGKNIWKILPYTTGLQFHQELHRAFDNHVSVHFEEYIQEKQKWFSVNAYPANEGLAVYFRDITDEREYRIRIEERNKLLTDIAWIQAHKIRGPVANILGLSHLFNYENPTDPINREILDNLRVTINDLDEVIKEVVQKTNLTINS